MSGWSNTSTQTPLQHSSGFSFGGGGGGGTSASGSMSGIDNPEALKMLMDYLGMQLSGGTEEEKALRAERLKQIALTRANAGDYTKGAAFADAAALMAQNLRQAMEKQMPAINKAIQGAGTSAGSMQALLSQKLATESSQAASALGAEQAKAYGGISAQLQAVLEALTRADATNSNAIANAFNNLKVTRSYSSAINNPTNPTLSITSSGQDTPGATTSAPKIQDGVWYGPGMVPRDQAWINATSNLPPASPSAYNESYGRPLISPDRIPLPIDSGMGWDY